MRKTSLFLLISAWSIVAQQRSGILLSHGFAGSNNIELQFAVVAEPPDASLATLMSVSGIASSDSGNGASRFVIDKVHRQYFGYDISAEATSAGGQYRVTIAPLTWIPPKDQGHLTPVLLPKYPEPQIMNETDTLELDLLVSPDGKQKVVDYIQVSKKPEPPAATNDQQPKDYTLDDGPINFDFENETSVWVDGEKYPGSYGAEIKTGATVWFYYPGQGRYILSLVPHEGFSQTGAVRDNVIAFQGEGQQFEIRTMKLIVGQSKGAWNLYVLHDPSYQLKERDQVQFGTDRLENLLPKR
jgi:hypothetical protein